MSLSEKVPPYMAMGSKGPHVDLWLGRLEKVAIMLRVPNHGIVPDQTYQGWGVGWTRAYQVYLGLKPDGGVGQDTRAAAREKDGFDFEALALQTPGTTCFVQLDGTVIEWTSPAVAQESGS